MLYLLMWKRFVQCRVRSERIQTRNVICREYKTRLNLKFVFHAYIKIKYICNI